MPQTPQGVNEIGLVSGPSKKSTPEDNLAAAALAQEVAVSTAKQIGRHTKNEFFVTLSDDREVTCKTAKVGQIGLVLDFLMKVAEKMEILSIKEDYLKQRFERIQDDPIAILTLMQQTEEFIWPLMGALTSLGSAPAVKNLEVDDAVLIARALYDLNKDFFLKRVLPLFLGQLATREKQQG